jgi:hypothetical protein
MQLWRLLHSPRIIIFLNPDLVEKIIDDLYLLFDLKGF